LRRLRPFVFRDAVKVSNFFTSQLSGVLSLLAGSLHKPVRM
jgi:hypothetical protein